jgi:hypothetical protein
MPNSASVIPTRAFCQHTQPMPAGACHLERLCQNSVLPGDPYPWCHSDATALHNVVLPYQ